MAHPKELSLGMADGATKQTGPSRCGHISGWPGGSFREWGRSLGGKLLDGRGGVSRVPPHPCPLRACERDGVWKVGPADGME